MPRKNNTRQRLFEAALGLPIEPTKAQRLAFIKEHNPDLKKSTVGRLSSELTTLRGRRAANSLIHVIGHAHAVAKGDDARFWQAAVEVARRIRDGKPFQPYEIQWPLPADASASASTAHA